jgi:predicted transcriptional regulator
VKIPLFMIRGFKRPSDVFGSAFGKLEREVMEIAWQRSEVSVRDAYRMYDERVAYTTLMTTFDRLFRKGILNRRKYGRAYMYSPRISRREFEHGIARDLIEGVIFRESEGAEPLLACIVDTVSQQDRALLDELDRMIREKKRELQRKS